MKNNSKLRRTCIASGIIIPKTKSRFEYPLYKYYFKLLLYVLMSALSILSLLPLAYYLYMKDKTRNMYIDNKKVIFKGTIFKCYQYTVVWIILFVLLSFIINLLTKTYFMDWLSNSANIFTAYIKKFILSSPTVLLVFIIVNRLYRWGLTNIYFGTEYGETYIKFDPKIALKSFIITRIAKLTVIGIPLEHCLRNRYLLNNTYISGRKVYYSGTIKEAYKWIFFRMILVVLTLFLYYPVYLYKKNKLATINTHVI